MSSTKTVTDATFRSEVLEHEKPILVDFWAQWCGPCRAVSPILDKIAEENTGKVKAVVPESEDDIEIDETIEDDDDDDSTFIADEEEGEEDVTDIIGDVGGDEET